MTNSWLRPLHVMTVWASALSVLLVAAACSSGGDPDGDAMPAAGTPTDSTVSLRDRARDAYIFTYPLVMNYRTMYRQAIEGDRSFGTWLHRGAATPQDTDIVTPSYDTPYSYAWVDLRAQPWILTLPPIEQNRYYVSQWDDLWGFVLDNPGSVEDGNDGIAVMLANPEWSGELPDGVSRVIKGESEFLGSLTRTEMLGSDDGVGPVNQIQQGYTLQPLSTYLNTPAPAPAPAIEWPAWTEGDETTEKYWDYVSLLLPFTTDNPRDQEMYDALADLGIKRGEPFDQSSLPQDIREALQGGIDDGLAELEALSQGDVKSEDVFGDREKMGTDYVNRALGVYMGIFGNTTDQAVYFPMTADAGGEPLDGSTASYSLTFAPGQLPPAENFWSLTMYRLPERLLVANPTNRYSIGSSTPGVRENSDGSTTFYFSANDPGGDKASNWLPAPDGPFWLVLRTYGPGQAILDKTWQPPKIEKMS